MSLNIENFFTYHTPNQNQIDAMKDLRDRAKELAYRIEELCPPSPDRTVAVRKLRECIMIANASIIIPPEEV